MDYLNYFIGEQTSWFLVRLVISCNGHHLQPSSSLSCVTVSHFAFPATARLIKNVDKDYDI